jgi:hypothetical protein
MQEGASGAQADDVAALAVVLNAATQLSATTRRANLALSYSAEGGNRLRPAALNPVANVDQYFATGHAKRHTSDPLR